MLRLTREKTAFLCCDIQEIFKRTVFQFEHVSVIASLLVRGAQILNIPVVISEQYPERLGKTCEPIDMLKCHVFTKTRFSMITDGFPKSVLDERSSFVLFGIETHVCVQQTALDLLQQGKSVVLVTDAVSSSRPLDRTTAIQRLSQDGATLMTAESVLFELMRTKDCPEFKPISSIAKEIAAYNAKGPILSTL